MSGDPVIGLKLGAEARLERYDPAAIAAVCSRSFRDAVQRIAFYKQLSCPEEIRIRTARDETSVEFAFIQAEGDEPDVLVDICLSWIFSIGQKGTDGNVKPLRVELIRPVRHRELLEAHFGSRVRFKADRNVLVFRSSDLDRPFITHNPELLKVVGAQLETEVQARNASSDIGEQVEQRLRHSLAGRRPTLQHVAKDLHLSVRTLQRRLGDAGITFQQLVEETRRELAHHYLKQERNESRREFILKSAILCTGVILAGPAAQRLVEQGNQRPDTAKMVASKGYAGRDTSAKLSTWSFERRPVGDDDILIEIKF